MLRAPLFRPKPAPKPAAPLPPSAAPAPTPSSLPPAQPQTTAVTPAAEPAREATPPPVPAASEDAAGWEDPTTASGPTWDDDPAQAWSAPTQPEPVAAEEEPVQTASEPETTQAWQDPAIVSMSNVAPAAAPTTPLSETIDTPSLAETPSLASTTATAATSVAATPSIASLSSPPPGLSNPATPSSPALAAGIAKPSTPIGLSRKGLNRFKSSGESPVILPGGVGLGGSPLSFGQFGGAGDGFMRFGSLSLGGDDEAEV